MILGDEVIYELYFPHPPERVWRALTDPSELAEWLMPAPGFAPVAGQRFTMSCDPVGEIDAEVAEIDPPRRLVMRWKAAFGTTTVSVELTAAGTGTSLRLVHSGWGEATAARDQFDSGWPVKLGTALPAVLGREPAG